MADRKVKDWIESYLEYTDHTEPCHLYREWVAVSTIASCLQRKCYLDWGQTVYPNLYVILVGPSGARKGTAMGYGRYFLKELKVRMVAESITREALIREVKNATENLTDPENPGLIGVTHASVTVHSPELTVFIGWDNKQLMMDLTDLYDCNERWEYRTKNMGTDTIHGPWINILGATTPDLVQKTLPLDAVGGGLTARMMFVYASRKGKISIFPQLSKEDEGLRNLLLQDLEEIKMMRGQFKITEAFLDSWADWYPKQDGNNPFSDVKFSGYFERRPWTMLKMSMIVSASRSSSMIIDAVDFREGLEILKRVEIPMKKTLAGVGKRDDADVMSKIMSYIGMERETTFNDILAVFYNDVDPEGLARIILTLQKINYCDVVEKNRKTIIKYKEK
uniref:Putative primase n=1 Tax=viral metagenome TaxID=1070528 RepID=A0A6M3KMF2_9ZZZZ